MVHVYVRTRVPWYSSTYWYVHVYVLEYVPWYVHVYNYLKNNFKYKHSGATGTLAS
jgi:hypothetical protein